MSPMDTAKRLRIIAQGSNPGWGVVTGRALKGHQTRVERLSQRNHVVRKRRPISGANECALKALPTPRTRDAILFNRFAVFLCALVLTLVSPTRAEDQKLSSVRIGYQKYGTLNVLKAEGSLEKSLSAKGITVTWTLFPAAPPLLGALNAGRIDFCNTATEPPDFAQSAGGDLVYLG